MKLLVFLLLLSSAYFFTLSEVDNNFSKCRKFFLNNDPPDFTALASQCLQDDEGKQIYLYATLYSTTWKIPVYSAYVFRKNKSIGRCNSWYIEPQLDGVVSEPCMLPKGSNTNIGTNQALNSDYDNSGYDRGHLYPVQHTNNHLSMLATFTLTNAAPQNREFNQKAWNDIEKAVATDLESCERAYVVTGVVPDTNIDKIGNPKTVTVSKYYWTATCCLKNNQYTGKGYYGPDNNGNVQKQLTIKELQNILNGFYKIPKSKGLQIFPSIPPPPDQPAKKPKTEYPCN